MSHSEFNKNAANVATNIQKLVQNVSSMQRMLVHVDSQGYPAQKAKEALQVVMEEMISMLVKKEKLVLMEDQEK